VTAIYDSTADQIRLTSGSEIILGSATDTSNFLQVAKLSNNGTGTIQSATTLGAVRTSRELAASNLATALNATGEFKINGVSFTYDSAVDSLDNLLNRINASTAGVNASYDSTQDRILLTNRVPGDLGIGLEDVSGNFLAASGLTTGALQRGRNLQYSINGGGTLTSASNTISEVSSGIAGLNVTVQTEGTFTIGVAIDSTAIKSAIKGFVDEYNKTQALININSASTTDSKGKVTAGALSGDSTVSSMNSDLRRLMTGTLTGLSGTILRMESLGFTSNGNDDSLIASDESRLDQAIGSDLSSLKDFFSNASTGLATQFNRYLDKTIGDGGTLVTRQTNLTAESKKIDDSIATMERVVQANKARLTQSFLAMETAQSNINQQLSYLQRYFGQ
jgi:flagellar hook-associated protein 2